MERLRQQLLRDRHVGAGLGFEYATHMDHFSIGVDVFWRMVLAGQGINTLQFFPRVKYTF